MKFSHHDLEIELNDDWWLEAEMSEFEVSSRAYRVDATNYDSCEIFEIAMKDVAPVRRNQGVGIFNNKLAKVVSGDLLPHSGAILSCNFGKWNHHSPHPRSKSHSKWDCNSSTQTFASGSNEEHSARERVVSILKGFKSCAAIPPVGLYRGQVFIT